jgi:ribonuclease HI
MIKIFTDGACSGKSNIGGWGLIVLDENDKTSYTIKGAKEDSTNNEMELTAVLQALIYMQDKPNIPAIIYTDSAYIANCIKDHWYKRWQYNGWLTEKKTPVCNKQLWQQIISMLSANITITKVKGHSDSVGNSAADRLAVSARLDKEKTIK